MAQSVSDDSKMKLMEIKYQLLYDICKKQIKDPSFQKLFSLIELKYENPDLYDVIKKYETMSTDIDVESIHHTIYETIKDKCIDLLQLISGQDIDRQALSDSEIQSMLSSKLDVLSNEINQNHTLEKQLEKNYETYQTLVSEYMDNVMKYYQKYKIPFKLSYDEIQCTLHMSKAQTLCVRKRLAETEAVVEKYGNIETIKKLTDERKSLESENHRLESELMRAEGLLAEYEGLDKGLLKEYKRVKSDLECRMWAINELNKSSGSSLDE
ncbi:uncharacterized protein LOC128955444 isoform X2 [Oppia nitens]|nr:uncharacterized protein LOC128955444 isoform X2 [Oppia nitens]